MESYYVSSSPLFYARSVESVVAERRKEMKPRRRLVLRLLTFTSHSPDQLLAFTVLPSHHPTILPLPPKSRRLPSPPCAVSPARSSPVSPPLRERFDASWIAVDSSTAAEGGAQPPCSSTDGARPRQALDSLQTRTRAGRSARPTGEAETAEDQTSEVYEDGGVAVWTSSGAGDDLFR